MVVYRLHEIFLGLLLCGIPKALNPLPLTVDLLCSGKATAPRGARPGLGKRCYKGGIYV